MPIDNAPRGTVAARVQSDGRIAYYPSGIAGVGRRKHHRCGTREEAVRIADSINTQARGGTDPLQTHYDACLYIAFFAFLDHLKAVSTPEGTWRQYKSNWNCWMQKEVAVAPCSEVGERHWALLFTKAVEDGAGVGTIRSLARTLGSLMTWGMENGYFPDEPFGPPRMRHQIVKRAEHEAISRDGDKAEGITIEHCPKPSDIDRYADAFEVYYPGYGRRLTLLAFHCGPRIMEVAALRADDIDLDELRIAIKRQLDRGAAWPAARLPKNHKTRTTDLWAVGEENAASLIADARARTGPAAGWLFPPDGDAKGWPDRLSAMATDAARDCGWDVQGWTFHWIRHSYATYSLAPTSAGGYGLELTAVQHALGHADSATTQRSYVQKLDRDPQRLRRITSRVPGIETAGE